MEFLPILLVKFIPKCFMVFDGIVNAFTYFIFHLFAVSKRNQLSLYIYLLSCHLINLLVSNFFYRFCRVSFVVFLLSLNRNSFTSSFPSFMLFFPLALLY